MFFEIQPEAVVPVTSSQPPSLRVRALLKNETQSPESGIGASENEEGQDEHHISSNGIFVVAELHLFCGCRADMPEQRVTAWACRCCHDVPC